MKHEGKGKRKFSFFQNCSIVNGADSQITHCELFSDLCKILHNSSDLFWSFRSGPSSHALRPGVWFSRMDEAGRFSLF